MSPRLVVSPAPLPVASAPRPIGSPAPGAAAQSTSPTSRSTADPTATSRAAPASPAVYATPIPTPAAPAPSPPLSPLAKPFHPAGRSKILRWRDSGSVSPRSGDSGPNAIGVRSFRDVVASSADVATPEAPPAVVKPLHASFYVRRPISPPRRGEGLMRMVG